MLSDCSSSEITTTRLPPALRTSGMRSSLMPPMQKKGRVRGRSAARRTSSRPTAEYSGFVFVANTGPTAK